MNLTIVLPCKNEAQSLPNLLQELSSAVPLAEIIVVDDGSTDNSAVLAEQAGVTVIRHQYSLGNGAAVKTGLRSAKTDYVLCMDADGQHRPNDIRALLAGLEEGYDMVVGARQSGGQANIGRSLANRFYNWFSGLMVGHTVKDLTSGMRAFQKNKAMEFIHLLPNGFSYPTTLTMAFFRAGYAVAYTPIQVHPRKGKSHLSLLKDGVRFLLIIFKVGTLYSPLKIFFPVSFAFFAAGLAYYIYTFFSQGRFTNMSLLLFSTAVIIFLIGLISEQITALHYKDSQK